MMMSLPTDFAKSLERKNSIFVFSVSLLTHTALLREATGNGFNNSIFTHYGELGTLFHSAKEIDELNEYYRKLALEDEERVRGWYEKGQAWNKKADELVREYSQREKADEECSEEIIGDFIQIFLYSTVIPFWVLSGISSGIEKGDPEEKYDNLIKLFEELRGQTRYPRFVEVILSKYYSLLARKVGADAYIIEFLTFQEYVDILKGKKKINSEEIKRRQEWCVASIDVPSQAITISYDKEVVESVLPKPEDLSVKEFKGSVAYRGVAKGTVKIVNATEEMKGFNDGQILVSINTNPSLMPAIMKCGAIITDEGGIMCHAAIVSRELKKPCITATKIATKVLKDGDMVEVDADRGIVKILK